MHEGPLQAQLRVAGESTLPSSDRLPSASQPNKSSKKRKCVQFCSNVETGLMNTLINKTNSDLPSMLALDASAIVEAKSRSKFSRMSRCFELVSVEARGWWSTENPKRLPGECFSVFGRYRGHWVTHFLTPVDNSRPAAAPRHRYMWKRNFWPRFDRRKF